MDFSEKSQISSSKSYVPSLDGIRGISIFIVILSHVGLKNIVPGVFGVTVFFIVSGLILTQQLLDERSRTSTINIRMFYMRRVVRLVPALIFYIIMMSVIFIIDGLNITISQFLSAVFYGANYYEIFGGYDSPSSNIPHPFVI